MDGSKVVLTLCTLSSVLAGSCFKSADKRYKEIDQSEELTPAQKDEKLIKAQREKEAKRLKWFKKVVCKSFKINDNDIVFADINCRINNDPDTFVNEKISNETKYMVTSTIDNKGFLVLIKSEVKPDYEVVKNFPLNARKWPYLIILNLDPIKNGKICLEGEGGIFEYIGGIITDL